MNYKYLSLCFITASVIFCGSSVPGRTLGRLLIEGGHPFWGLVHVGAFGMMAFFSLKGIGRVDAIGRDWKRDILIVCALILFSVFDEFHQSFIPGRTASFGDILVDLVGIGAGLALIRLSGKLRDRATKENWGRRGAGL